MYVNKECAVVRDLLPLYVDAVCSEGSRELVEQHLQGCSECTAIWKSMGSDLPEKALNEELSGVLKRQAKRFKRRSALAGAIIGGILMLPVLICLIVILASGHGFDWFFIVLSSLLLAASITVVPLAVAENKLFWTLASFLLTLLLLLGVCCRTSGGRWFFVAATACTFGLSVIFLPIAVNQEPLRRALGNQKGLAVMAADTVLYVLMMVSIGVYVRSAEYASLAYWISLPFVLFAWALFALIRYPRFGGLIKGGFCVMLCGAFLFFAEPLVNGLLGNPVPLPEFHPLRWAPSTLDGNVMWTILLASVMIGLVLIAAGLVRHGRKQDET